MTTGATLSESLLERLRALRASGYSHHRHTQTEQSWAKVREFVRSIPNDYRRLIVGREPQIKRLTVTRGKDTLAVEVKLYDWVAQVHGHDVAYQIALPVSPEIKDRAVVTAYYEPKGLCVIKDLTSLSL